MNHAYRIIPTKMSYFQTICFLAVVMFPSLAVAQLAPTSLTVPSSVVWSGNFTDSEEGVISESKSVRIHSVNNFTGSNIDGDSSIGTYTYTKTGANLGRIIYTAIYTYLDENETETESGTVNLTFTSATGGTFTSSGTWATSNGFNGTFTNGSGAFTYNPNAQFQKQRDLVGTWGILSNGTNQAYITFLDNGTYHHVETGIPDDRGFPGLEVGTYTWNTSSGTFSSSPGVDQNDEWGLSHNAPDIRLFVHNGLLQLVENRDVPFLESDVAILERPTPSVPAILGSWVIISEGRPAVIIFLADGTYRHSEVGAPVGGGFSGMEAGTYVWNSITGALSATPTLDQNGDWGLSHPLAPLRVSVSGDQLTILEGSLPFLGQRADARTALSAFLGDASIPYNQRAPLADPDGDGISNLMEYALGLAPNSPNAAGLPTAAPALNPATGQNHLVMTMTLNANASGISNIPQVTSNLSGWNSGNSHIQTVSDTVSNGVRTLVVRDLTPIGSVSGRRFMRLSVIQP